MGRLGHRHQPHQKDRQERAQEAAAVAHRERAHRGQKEHPGQRQTYFRKTWSKNGCKYYTTFDRDFQYQNGFNLQYSHFSKSRAFAALLRFFNSQIDRATISGFSLNTLLLVF